MSLARSISHPTPTPLLLFTLIPTHRYIPHTDDYDRRPDKKNRAPAWCDRVLWRSNGNDIQCDGYGRDEMKTSDHKPVYATFEAQVRTTVRHQQRAVYTQIMRALDRWENENIPTVSIDRNVVVFPEVRYKVRTVQTVFLENSGQVQATFRFVPKLEDKQFCKPWLSVYVNRLYEREYPS